MSDDLHDLNDLLGELEGLALKTSQGSFVKMEDVKKLIDKRQAVNAIDSESSFKGKTFEQAKAAIKKDPAFASLVNKPPREPGRSVPAMDPQSSSRT